FFRLPATFFAAPADKCATRLELARRLYRGLLRCVFVFQLHLAFAALCTNIALQKQGGVSEARQLCFTKQERVCAVYFSEIYGHAWIFKSLGRYQSNIRLNKMPFFLR